MLLVFRRVHCVWGNYFITGLGFGFGAECAKEKINVATPTISAGEKKRYSEYFFFFFSNTIIWLLSKRGLSEIGFLPWPIVLMASTWNGQ